MAVTLVVNGTGYSFPNTGDESWGDNVTNWATAVTSSMLQKTGGTFTLSAEVYFGASFGLKSLYYKSTGATVAAAGVVRLANLEKVSWRNAANGADLPLSVNASDQLTYNGVAISSSSGITPATAGGTGFASYAVGDTLYASTTTAFSKLNIGTVSYVMLSTGAIPSWGQIVNASVDAAAAIARSKMAAGTNYRILANTSAGVMSENAALTATHVIFADANGQLSGEATLSKSRGGAGADMSSVTFPSSGTIATIAGTQVLTNKDYDGGVAANTSRVTFPKDTLANITALTRKEGTVWYASDVDKLYKDDGVSLTEIGSGSGGINYIGNPDAEGGTSGWATYADAAGVAPVDGTGGSPSITWTQSASSPLRGTNNFLLTKGATNRQGDGVSYDFTIASADKAKPLNISFEYAISANAVAGSDSATGDINVYIVADPSGTPTVIQPAPYKMPGGTGNPWKFSGTFQTLSNVTSYRLCLHVAGTNASAATYQFDNFIVGPQILMYGAPVTDWNSYTPTTQGLGTIATNSSQWRRVGDSMEVNIKFTTGTVSASEMRVNLPTGYTVGTPFSAITVVGKFARGSAAATSPKQGTVKALAGNAYLTFGTDDYTTGSDPVGTNRNGDAIMGSSETFSFSALVPIAGWGSNTVMSQDSDTRVVAFRATNVAGTTLTKSANNTVPFATADYDTHGAFATDTYTCPLPGKYVVKAGVTIASGATWAANDYIQIEVLKNGTGATGSIPFYFFGTATGTFGPTVNATVNCVAGDTLKINVFPSKAAASNVTLNTAAGYNFFVVERLSGPATIAATETVAAKYTSTAAQSITTGSYQTLTHATKSYDTHGACSAGSFTCPIPGKYNVAAFANFASNGGWNGGEVASLAVHLNGTIDTVMGSWECQAAGTLVTRLGGQATVNCVAGDVLTVKILQNSGGTIALDSTAANNWITFTRVNGVG